MVTDNSNSEAKILASFFKLKGRLLVYKKGRRLLTSDILGMVIYVRSGYLAAHLSAQPSHSRPRAYYTFGPGNLIQIRSLVSDEHLELTYTPLTNVTLYAIPSNDVWKNLHKNTALAAAMIRDSILHSELLTRRIENLSFRYASDKLTYRILNLAERFGVAKDGEIYIRIPVTHRQLGTFINMARESVSREMEKLVSRGLIRYERQHITITDVHKLVDAMHESFRTDWGDLLVMADTSKKISL